MVHKSLEVSPSEAGLQMPRSHQGGHTPYQRLYHLSSEFQKTRNWQAQHLYVRHGFNWYSLLKAKIETLSPSAQIYSNYEHCKTCLTAAPNAPSPFICFLKNCSFARGLILVERYLLWLVCCNEAMRLNRIADYSKTKSTQEDHSADMFLLMMITWFHLNC